MLTLFVEHGRDTPLDGRRDSMTMGTTTASIPASVFDGLLPALPPAQVRANGNEGATAVGVDPWSMLTRREGFGLVCMEVALGIARRMGDMGAPRACAERGKYHGPCIGGMWDVARSTVVEGQGRAGPGMA